MSLLVSFLNCKGISFGGIGVAIVMCLLPLPVWAHSLPVLEPSYSAPEVIQNPSGIDLERNQYFLGAGDKVQLEIFNAPDYSREYEISSDGSLNLPLIGSVRVEGNTLTEAADKIRTAYAQFIRSPSITLNLSQTRPVQIAIAGEVNRPGAYNIDSLTTETDPITITKAIQLAGGITRLADIRQIQILRSQTSSAAPPSVYIDLWQLIESGDLTQDLQLRDGDTVLVPVATALDSTDSTRVATANFSPDDITIYVVGEVANPGAVKLPLNAPLNQALLASGGFTNRAVEGTVELVRLNPNGTVAQQEVAVNFSQDVNEAGNPVLQNNDTIVVRETGLARTSDTANLILSPLSGILGLLRLLF